MYFNNNNSNNDNNNGKANNELGVMMFFNHKKSMSTGLLVGGWDSFKNLHIENKVNS